MRPTIEDGALVQFGPVDSRRLRPGDLVLVSLPGGALACHRVLWVFRRRGQRWVQTGPDFFIYPDKAVPADQVIGRVEAITSPTDGVTRTESPREAWKLTWKGRLRPWVRTAGDPWERRWETNSRTLFRATTPEGVGSGTSATRPQTHRLNRNQLLYDQPMVIEEYAQASHLFPSEETILKRLGSRLADMRMLDLGVGAGRTTLHFAPRAKYYLGVDSAPRMIEACHARFPAPPPHWSFRVGDARSLSFIEDASIDFVLFSALGLDYVSQADRLHALQEIRRVCADGGLFFFSSNNLQSLRHRMRFVWWKYPPLLLAEVRRQIRLRWHNPGLARLCRGDYAQIYDGLYAFHLLSYYIRPRHQVAQLGASGFQDVEVFDEAGQLVSERAWDTVSDSELHYLARAAPRW